MKRNKDSYEAYLQICCAIGIALILLVAFTM
jgi:hypothetical protein